MDMMQCVRSIDAFENDMRERMKKYKKALRGLTMYEHWKSIDAMAIEIMCCCLEREESGNVSMKETIKNNADMAFYIMNFLSNVQYRIQQYYTKQCFSVL
eukprot:5002930-Ditylum_brightwellii.AAC.1